MIEIQKEKTHREVPTPFHSPRNPSAFNTCRKASIAPFTRSVFHTPASQTQTTSPGIDLIANEDMFRIQPAAFGWQQVLRGGRGKSRRG